MEDTCRVTRVFVLLIVCLTLVAVRGAEADAAKQYRVALVVGPASGGGIDRLYWAGLQRAVRDFGVEARIVVQPVRTSRTSTNRALARSGYDLVIAGFGQLQAGGVITAARSSPKTQFALSEIRAADVNAAGLGRLPPNVATLSVREEEIGFVVGYLAGLVERLRPGPDAVGSVGGLSFVPAVERFIAGYRAGARRASPGIRLLNGYSNDFGDPDPCRRVASAQIAKGAGVIFNVAGGCGLGTLAAARDAGIWGIGVDQDQSALGPHVLTSALKRFDVIVYRIVEQLVRGRLEGGRDTLFGLREGVVALGKVSPKVPSTVVVRTRRISSEIASGRITGIPTTVP